MTDSMIERVARAIAAVHIAEVKGTDCEPVVAERVESRWMSYREEARAAIAAMREPTEAMVDAGYACDGTTTYDATAFCETHWRAMIDAALAEGAGPEPVAVEFAYKAPSQPAGYSGYAVPPAEDSPFVPSPYLRNLFKVLDAESDATLDAAIERAAKAPNKPAKG